MKTYWFKMFQVIIIIIFAFGLIKPTIVFADDTQTTSVETIDDGSEVIPVEAGLEEEPIVTPDENDPSQQAGEVVEPIETTDSVELEEELSVTPEGSDLSQQSGEVVEPIETTEDESQSSTEEKSAQTESLSEVIDLLVSEGMMVTDQDGEALPMASIETLEVITNSDPFFYNSVVRPDPYGVVDLPVGWVGYTVDGTGCPANVNCRKADKPFTAAVAMAEAGSTIYVANGIYNEDLVISTANLSFSAFNAITVNADSTPPTVTHPGFAKVNSITLNANFGSTSGVYADSVIVNSNGYLSDALNLVNPANVEATITAQMNLFGSGDYYRIQDSNHPGDSYEWECGEPDVSITFNNYTMILKNPYSADVLNYYSTNSDQRPDFSAMDSSTYISKNYSSSEANLLLTAQERMDDVISAASASEIASWSNMDEQRVFWNLLGHMSGNVDGNNHTGSYDGNLIQTANQFDLAKQFTFTDNQDLPGVTQKLWFLWPSGSANPSNTQLTFMKLAIPTTGCTDPATCTACSFGETLVSGVGCQPIVCTYGNKLNAAGNGCEPIVCTPGNKLNAAGDGCEPIACTPGNKLNAAGNGCEPIVCTTGNKLNAAGNACEPIVCGIGEQLVGNNCVTIPVIDPDLGVKLPLSQSTGNGLLIPQTGGLLIPVTGVPIIVAGLGHTCMTYGNSQVVCWGLNASGQDGNGTYENQLVPVYVKDLTGVVDLTAGSLHTCALDIEGKIWCWGENSSGQLGNGSNENSNIPVLVEGLPDKAIDVTGGEKFTCAQLNNNEVWCWGENGIGQLNDGTTNNSNIPVMSLLNQSQNAIAAGQEALLGDAAGNIDTWSNTQSILVEEIGSSLFLFGDRWNEGGCAVDEAGQVKCWDVSKVSTPIEKSLPAYMVETGIGHGCALNLDGSISCWGLNNYGQLGIGTNTDNNQASLVKNISEAKEIGIGRYHSCALVGEGYIPMCWGENTYGQLGNDSMTNNNLPVFVKLPPQ